MKRNLWATVINYMKNDYNSEKIIKVSGKYAGLTRGFSIILFL